MKSKKKWCSAQTLPVHFALRGHVDRALLVFDDQQQCPAGRYLNLKSHLGFTGIDSPYEPPLNPECVVKSGEDSIDTCVAKVIKTLDDNGVLKGKRSPQYNKL